jgi:hypothetical protein
MDAQRQRAVGCSAWLDGSWLSRIVLLNHLQRIERENVSNLPAINGAPAGACLIWFKGRLIWHERDFEAVFSALKLDSIMAQVAVNWVALELATLLALEYPNGDCDRLRFFAGYSWICCSRAME